MVPVQYCNVTLKTLTGKCMVFHTRSNMTIAELKELVGVLVMLVLLSFMEC